MLTDSIIQKAKPKAKQYRLSDGNGLSLLVYPTGGKCWRYRYSFAGKESMISLGAYPDISLEEARKRLAEARTTKATGTDPRKTPLSLLLENGMKSKKLDGNPNMLKSFCVGWNIIFSLLWDPAL
jgi:hypothetical protein